MKQIGTLILMPMSFFINSCNNKGLDKFLQHKEQLQKFAEHLKNSSSVEILCCVDQECFTSEEKSLLRMSGFSCVRRDTNEQVIAFISAPKDKVLENEEILFYYGDQNLQPSVYPKAGETLKKLDNNWYIRYYNFD